MPNRVRDTECLMLTIFTFKTWKIYDVCHIFIACRIRYETRITTWCCRFYSVNQETNVRCLSHFCCVPKLQNHAARALTFSSCDADASQLFQNLNWKNLSTQRDIQKALMVFKSLNGLASWVPKLEIYCSIQKHFIHCSRSVCKEINYSTATN